MIHSTHTRVRASSLVSSGLLACACVCPLAVQTAAGQIVTNPTMDTGLFETALQPFGLSIDSVSIVNGMPGQFGTYSNFEIRPVTIRPGIVLSSGDVTNLGPIPGATDPDYEPASPPQQVNNQMTPDPDSGGTAEFDAFGSASGNIENFSSSFDVAALRVDFSLEEDSSVKFDFVFGSVEFPFWTGMFTDAFLVFLDGTDPADQIAFDAAGNAVQVGSSFAGFERTDDLNTAFSNPHGLIHHLTTTTARLSSGRHYLIFEIGDVNDHILDSAVFISSLRAEAGTEGTEPSEDPPYAGCPHIVLEPDPATACLLGSATFTVDATGDGTLSYAWRLNGVPIDPLVNPSAATRILMLTDLQLADAGDYRCIVTNSCGSEASDIATLSICPADYNCDGGVDGDDVIEFFGAWDASDMAADFNQDGGVDGDDVMDFFAHWDSGC